MEKLENYLYKTKFPNKEQMMKYTNDSTLLELENREIFITNSTYAACTIYEPISNQYKIIQEDLLE